jgi:hypothetical protein
MHLFSFALWLAVCASQQAPTSPGPEPTVREVQAASLAASRLDPATLESYRSRAAMKALAPEVEVSGGYTRSTLDEDTINQEFDPKAPWIVKGSGGNAWEVRGKVGWNFPELVFNAEELDAAGLVSLQEARLREVTRVFFERRRAQIERTYRPPSDPGGQALLELRLEELTAELDALTGGWFSTECDRRRTGAARAAQPRTQSPSSPSAGVHP